MKPINVIEVLRLTYDTQYMNDKFDAMVKGAYDHLGEVEKDHMKRFLFDGFSLNNIMRWQPHKDWYIPEVKEFLTMYKEHFIDKNNSVSSYMMVEDFFKQLASYTAAMMKEPPQKDEYPFWFLSMYLRPAMNS